MSKSQPAPLSAVIVRKGQATPISGVSSMPTASPAPSGPALEAREDKITASKPTISEREESKSMAERPFVPLPTKSMTVKVDIESYKKLKTHGMNVGKTSQDIFVEALALYFKTKKL
jgi:hypothetical protein